MPRGITNKLEDYIKYIRIDKESGCWIWTSYKYPNGYAKFCYEGRYISGHRAAYLHNTGSLPDNLVIHHKCERKDCVNPSHLEAVTPSSNIRRAISDKDYCRNGHRLTPENLYIRKRGDADCRECRKISLRKCRLRDSILDAINERIQR